MNGENTLLTLHQITEAITPLIWPILALAAALYFRKDVKRVIQLLLARIQEGSGVKVGPVELAALNVRALDSGDITNENIREMRRGLR